jgi:hypothetical protein
MIVPPRGLSYQATYQGGVVGHGELSLPVFWGLFRLLANRRIGIIDANYIVAAMHVPS